MAMLGPVLQLSEAPHFNIVADAFVVGTNLAAESNLTATEGPAGAQGAAPDTVKTEKLPVLHQRRGSPAEPGPRAYGTENTRHQV